MPGKRKTGKAPSISTKKGDEGKTGLIDRSVVSKASLRPEAYGILDEANSFLGLAKAKLAGRSLKRILGIIQDHIFIINSELACPPGKEAKLKRRVGRSHLLFLERQEKKIESRLFFPAKFILYGGTEVSAVLDIARSVVRRAERAVVRLAETDPLPNRYMMKYINRLSDVLFLLARCIEADEGVRWEHPGEG